MAKRRETLPDLIGGVAEPGETIKQWCERVGYPVRTVSRLMNDAGEPRLGTLTLLATLLQVDLARLRAAIAASRAAK